jgi:hypothetical protein
MMWPALLCSQQPSHSPVCCLSPSRYCHHHHHQIPLASVKDTASAISSPDRCLSKTASKRCLTASVVAANTAQPRDLYCDQQPAPKLASSRPRSTLAPLARLPVVHYCPQTQHSSTPPSPLHTTHPTTTSPPPSTPFHHLRPRASHPHSHNTPIDPPRKWLRSVASWSLSVTVPAERPVCSCKCRSYHLLPRRHVLTSPPVSSPRVLSLRFVPTAPIPYPHSHASRRRPYRDHTIKQQRPCRTTIIY